MEDWDVLAARKRKQIKDDYKADVAAAILRRDERLEKVRALSTIEDAVQMMVDCVQRCSKEAGT